MICLAFRENGMSPWLWGRRVRSNRLVGLGLLMCAALQAQVLGTAQHRQYKALNPTIEKAYKALKAQRFEETRALLDTCLSKIPEHFEAHYFLALMDYEGRNYASALQHLDISERTLAGLEKDYRAQVAEMKAKSEAAEREASDNLETARSRSPDANGAGATQISGLQMDLKMTQTEGKPVQGLDSPFSIPADYLFLRGNVLLRLGRKEEAREAYRRAVAADSGHSNAWNNLIALGLAARDHAGARADLTRAEAGGVTIHPGLKKAVQATLDTSK